MNIYITGLNYSINDADLNDLFAEYGEITSAKVIMDRETGRSRGFGFFISCISIYRKYHCILL